MSKSSLLEYAKFHDLIVDVRSEDLLNRLESLRCLPIENEAGIFAYNTLPAPLPPHEDKLQVSAGAGSFLARCMSAPGMPPHQSLLSDRSRSKLLLKLEMPMLESDHSEDMRWFRKPLDLDKLLKAYVESYSEQVARGDDGKDVLEECRIAADEVEREICCERLQTTKGVIATLSGYVKNRWSARDAENLWQRELCWSKERLPGPPTPMLAPILEPYMSEECLPPIPLLDSFAPEMESPGTMDDVKHELAPDSSTETSDVVEGDVDRVKSLLSIAVNAPNLEATYHSPFEEKPTVARHMLKMEVPLMLSPNAIGKKEDKAVDVEDLLEHYIDYPPEADFAGDEHEIDASISDTFPDVFEQSQRDVHERIMREPFGINEKTLRPQIPCLGRVDVQHPRSLQTPGECMAHYFDQAQIWSLPSLSREEKSLNWIPIPRRLMQVDLREEPDPSSYLIQSTKRPDNIMKSQQLLWKEPGIRLLNVDEEQDEHVEMDAELTGVLNASSESQLPRKRAPQSEPDQHRLTKLQKHCMSATDCRPILDTAIEAIQEGSIPKQAAARTTEITADPRLRRRFELSSATQSLGAGIPVLTPSSRRPPGSDSPSKNFVKQSAQPFSATHSLSSFLDLRKSKFKKPAITNPTLNRDPEVASDPIQASQMMLFGREGYDLELVEVPSTPRHISVSSVLACPAPEQLSVPRSIVADETLVAHRAILKMLDKHADHNLTTIYRDLKSQPDMILDPTTCLTYTNVQELTQRSLPGQKASTGETAVQARVKALASEYESVFILATVSASLTEAASQAQSSSMASFASFCASFDGSQDDGRVCPLWIPVEACIKDQPKQDPLCAWTWHLICRHAFRSNVGAHQHYLAYQMPLIQEVSVWELFLCKCGMNAMAAQVVLGMLKKPTDLQQSDASSDGGSMSASQRGLPGLRQFVNMSQEQRHMMFEKLVGRKCLTRVRQGLGAA